MSLKLFWPSPGLWLSCSDPHCCHLLISDSQLAQNCTVTTGVFGAINIYFFFYSFQFPKKYSMTYLSSSLVPIGTNLKPMIIQITCMTPKSHLPTTILPLSPNFVSFSLLLFHSCSLFPSFTSLLTSFFLWQLGKIHSSCSLCSPRFC